MATGAKRKSLPAKIGTFHTRNTTTSFFSLNEPICIEIFLIVFRRGPVSTRTGAMLVSTRNFCITERGVFGWLRGFQVSESITALRW